MMTVMTASLTFKVSYDNRVPGEDDDGAPSPKNIKDIQDQQAGKVQIVVDKYQAEHQPMLQLLRQKITELRALELVEPPTKASHNACKEAWAEAKKSLRQFTDTLTGKGEQTIHMKVTSPGKRRDGKQALKTRAAALIQKSLFSAMPVLNCSKMTTLDCDIHGKVSTSILKTTSR